MNPSLTYISNAPEPAHSELDIKCCLEDPNTYCHFVEMLLPHVERWRNLEITFDGPLDYGCVGNDAQAALVLLRGIYAPHLENLNICVIAQEFEPTCPIFVNGAPQLRTAILQGNFCFAEASFKNLVKLELSTDLLSGPDVSSCTPHLCVTFFGISVTQRPLHVIFPSCLFTKYTRHPG